jgi:tRNA threonylcarbamoyladenosine biosynthesis protein TsaB
MLVLAVDTCGPTGSVALARIAEAGNSKTEKIELLGQMDLVGGGYSATLVPAIDALLTHARAHLAELDAIVAVSGPGSFTGVRVGLSTAKGLAEPNETSVATVSRLAVLAHKAGTMSSVLDAHRNEIFLRVTGQDGVARELLAGQPELTAMAKPSVAVAVCDETAARILQEAWLDIELVRVTAPTAADAVKLAAAQVLAGQFVDLATLDGHYLRRSDAEIFGERSAAGATRR